MTTRGPFVRPGKCHPYQLRVWNDNSRFIVIRKSRRIGLSWTLLGRAVWRAIGPAATKTYYLSHTYDSGLGAMADVEWWADFFNAAALAMGKPSIWKGGKKSTALSKETAMFASGGMFKVLSAKARKLRGIPGAPDYIIDELAFHLEAEEMVKAAEAILLRARGTVTCLSTVMYEDTFWDLTERTIRDVERDQARGIRSDKSFHQITFDDALEEGFMEREAWVVADAVAKGLEDAGKLIPVQDRGFAQYLERLVGPEAVDVVGGSLYRPHARLEYRERVWRLVSEPDRELQCIPARAGSAYMPKELISKVLDDEHCEVFRFEASNSFLYESDDTQDTTIISWMEGPGRVLTGLRSNPPRRWYYGVDFGRSRDLTVISLGYIDGDVLKVPFMLELDNVPFRGQRLFFDQVIARVSDGGVVAGGALDEGAQGKDLAEHALRSLGEYRAEQVSMNNTWYMQHMPPFKRRFQERTIVIPGDEHVQGDLRQIKLIDGVPKIPRGERANVGRSLDGKRSKFRHGDAAISLVLLNYSARDAVANSGGYESQHVGLPPNRRRRGLG